jgi:uncharacterized membrane protein YccF (DUF307 family)
MKTLGNILWFLCGGIFSGLSWVICGFLWCITLIGIPVGVQCFKLAEMSFWPFGKEICYEGGAGSFLVNVLWFLFGGLEMALMNALLGLLWGITIVGIPFGRQFFKLAKLSLAPFGAVIAEKR